MFRLSCLDWSLVNYSKIFQFLVFGRGWVWPFVDQINFISDAFAGLVNSDCCYAFLESFVFGWIWSIIILVHFRFILVILALFLMIFGLIIFSISVSFN